MSIYDRDWYRESVREREEEKKLKSQGLTIAVLGALAILLICLAVSFSFI